MKYIEQFNNLVESKDFQDEILPLIEKLFIEELEDVKDINQFSDLWSCVFYKGYSLDVNFFDDEFHDKGENLILCVVHPNYNKETGELMKEHETGYANIASCMGMEVKQFSKNRLDFLK